SSRNGQKFLRGPRRGRNLRATRAQALAHHAPSGADGRAQLQRDLSFHRARLAPFREASGRFRKTVGSSARAELELREIEKAAGVEGPRDAGTSAVFVARKKDLLF